MKDGTIDLTRGKAPFGDSHLDSPIWWRGSQWAVTEDGIEALDGNYFIGRERLLEEAEEWPWVRQLSEKTWVDSDEFATAYMVALVLHGYSQVDAGALRVHFGKMARASQ